MLTEQQRAELERRVQRVKRLSNSYQPVYDTCVPSREWAQAVTEALEALASALQGKEGEKRSEIRYPVWWEPPENTNGEVESDRLAHVYEQTDGFPGDVAIARVFKPEHARRIAAALNATKGIPTETLEAGEVVPLALVDSIIREVLTNEEKYVPAAMLGNQGLKIDLTPAQRRVYQAIAELEQELGYAPTLRQVADRAGLRSTATVHAHLQRLLQAGLIRRASRTVGYTTARGAS